MSFLGVFRPAWQRSNPKTRLAATARSDYNKLLIIATQSMHDDTFEAAIKRLEPSGLGKVFYFLDNPPLEFRNKLGHQKHYRQINPWDIVRLRQKKIAEIIINKITQNEKINDSYKSNHIYAFLEKCSPELSLQALPNLEPHQLLEVLRKSKFRTIQESAFDLLLKYPLYLVDIVREGPPEFRKTALDNITDFKMLVELVHGQNVRIGDHVFRPRLDEMIDAAKAHGDWEAVKFVIPKIFYLDEKAKLVLSLPCEEIEEQFLIELAHDKYHGKPTYHLLQPILQKMSESGWQIKESMEEKPCPSCSQNPCPGYHEHDGVGYGCGVCAAKGRIRTITVIGSFQTKAFSLVIKD